MQRIQLHASVKTALNKSGRRSRSRLLVPFSLIFSSGVLASDPYFDNGFIRWSNPGNQWFQLQNTSNWSELCNGHRDSCAVSAAGTYKGHVGGPELWRITVTEADLASVGGTATTESRAGGYQNYTGPVTTFSGRDVEVRNRGRAEFFQQQTRAVHDIPFAHTIRAIGSNPQKTYGTPSVGPLVTTLEPGIYNSDHNDEDFTSSWGGHANQTGVNPEGDFYNFLTGNYEGGQAGNFRIKCQWSHFAYDDPIVKYADKRQGLTHLHMFWGNTAVDYNTELRNSGDDNFITKKGGSTCQGYGINRSSYWMPALMHNNDLAMVPREIVVYYKSNTFSGSTPGLGNNTLSQIATMPQGLQLITGNGDRPIAADGSPSSDDAFDLTIPERNLNKRHAIWGGVNEPFGVGDSWTVSNHVSWQCGLQGLDYRQFNRIPTAAEWEEFCVLSEPVTTEADTYDPADGPLNLVATIYFPQCREDNENPQLHNDNFRDHVRHIETNSGCPNGQVRMPRLGYRVYWDVSELRGIDGELSIDNLRLSSDPLPEEFTLPVSLTRTQLLQRQADGQSVVGESVSPGPTWRGGHDVDVNGDGHSDGLGGMLAGNNFDHDTGYRQEYIAAECTDGERVRGGTLHADWVAGWHDGVQDMWLDNCSRDGVNCTLGQTGTDLRLIADDIDYAGHPFSFSNSDGGSVEIPNSYMVGVNGSGHMHACSAVSSAVTDSSEPSGPSTGGGLSGELIANGDFQVVSDLQNDTNWRATNSATTAGIVYDGTNIIAQVSGRVDTWDGLEYVLDSEDVGGLSQLQTVSARVLVKLGSGGTQSVSLSVVTQDGSVWDKQTFKTVTANSWSWTEIEGDWTVNWTDELNYVIFRIDGPDPSVDLRIDDVSFSAE